ncbi:membrane protein insertase YidC [Sphingomonas sp. LY160]|uniref:membrane protein insertase YidC n=1 Tax=Sphingomonas sp. LY160 TaxID=3095342 RepID=UPI002ADED5F8|nr:membrane protein insertase YidC [Sphingomonas sp. LY160]MEA1071429.1 membrane protein insertase YidC [Sphingomonas sp. LY160]
MNDNRNMMLAIVLSALVLIGWSFLSESVWPTSGPQTQTVENGKVKPLPQPSADPAADSPRAIRDRAVVLAETPRVRIETPSVNGSINLKGARFDDLTLVRQREGLAKDSPAVRLLTPAGARDAYFGGFGWVGQGVAAPDANSVWTASAPVLTPAQPVTLSWTNATGQRFEQIVSVDDGYLFTIRQRVANLSPSAVGLRSYGLVSRAAKSTDADGWTMHVGPMSVLNGTADYDVNYDTLDEDRAGITRDASSGWLGFTDKYWLTALAPANGSNFAASLKRTPSGAYQADYAGAPFIVAPGQAVSGETHFFAGAKEKSQLDAAETRGITRLSKSIDWGWFEWFMRPIFGLLQWLFHATGNFGVAIICLTFIVRLLMFPIADKQFRSMAGMRRVQPKMKAIQERYKDDKPRLQQEMLKLYQTEKINPAAGCLPILLQIPVFYALYKVLMVSVEMRHQPFVAWIRDLSAPDPLTPVNLFGLLDFTPPHLLAIGVLPILVGVTQWISIKLNPQPTDPVQAQIFSIMPWVLIVVMAPFAAGLQLYWFVNNLLTIAQQKWLYYRYDHEMTPPTEVDAVATVVKK